MREREGKKESHTTTRGGGKKRDDGQGDAVFKQFKIMNHENKVAADHLGNPLLIFA